MDPVFYRYFIPIYFLSFSFLCFFWRSLIFYKHTKKNPLILGNSETPHGYVVRIAIILITFLVLVITHYSFWPERYLIFIPFPTNDAIQIFGLILLVQSLILTAVAQSQMGSSWRVGIETADKTMIIQTGLYRFSRNPIYLGIFLADLGIFMIIPSIATLFILIVGYWILQIIIRMEEAHLLKLHGNAYRSYCLGVRRWI